MKSIMKKTLVIFILFSIIMGVFCKKTQAETAKYGDIDNLSQFYSSCCILVDTDGDEQIGAKDLANEDNKRRLQSWKKYVEQAELKGGKYYVYVNTSETSDGTRLEFICSSQVREEILRDIEEKISNDTASNSSEEEDNETNLSEQEKNEIKSEVNEYISQIKTASNGDNQEYINLLQEQINTIKESNTGRISENDKKINNYRLYLYQKELEIVSIDEKYRDQFEEESKDMSLEDVDNKLLELESKKARLENMTSDYVEGGKTRDELLEEVNALIRFYTKKQGEEAVVGSEKNPTYHLPGRIVDEDEEGSGDNIEDAISQGKEFIKAGQAKNIDLVSFSDTYYNTFLSIGIAITVIVGMVLGINFMLSTVEKKAEIKELLLPYVVGCIVIYGSFGIWKIVVTIAGNII